MDYIKEKALNKIVHSHEDQKTKLLQICQLLQDKVSHYDWVGFYLAEETQRLLRLGPYVGAVTEHTKIPYGKGVCGAAAQSRSPQIVQDVSALTNYLACSLDVKAEIVFPVFKGARLVALLDIDSHQSAPFSQRDETFLKKVCNTVAELF